MREGGGGASKVFHLRLQKDLRGKLSARGRATSAFSEKISIDFLKYLPEHEESVAAGFVKAAAF